MLRVYIVETGLLLVVIRDCLFPMRMVIFMSNVELNELIYVVETMLTHHLVYIAVLFQLLLSMMKMTSQ